LLLTSNPTSARTRWQEMIVAKKSSTDGSVCGWCPGADHKRCSGKNCACANVNHQPNKKLAMQMAMNRYPGVPASHRGLIELADQIQKSSEPMVSGPEILE
jgi:hypothetical protein